METRSLNFKNVIILDVNDQVLPYLKIYEPLVPQEVMISLGLNRLENEEQLQRYLFRRLLAGSENGHLIFQENPRNELSRFAEELIWQRQKQEGRLDVLEIPKACFSIQSLAQRLVIDKEKDVLEYLKNIRYSASRIDVYLFCPLRFYYQYVLGLKKKRRSRMSRRPWISGFLSISSWKRPSRTLKAALRLSALASGNISASYWMKDLKSSLRKDALGELYLKRDYWF